MAIDINDTTLSYYGPKMSSGPCERSVPPLSSTEEYSGYFSTKQIIQNDTVRIFIYEKRFIQGEPLEEYFASVKQFQRYDLGMEDLLLLTNAQGNLEIHWPPDPRMRNMKMFPKYGYYND